MWVGWPYDEAIELRDRTDTFAHLKLFDLRRAARYAFHDEARARAAFSNPRTRKRRPQQAGERPQQAGGRPQQECGSLISRHTPRSSRRGARTCARPPPAAPGLMHSLRGALYTSRATLAERGRPLRPCGRSPRCAHACLRDARCVSRSKGRVRLLPRCVSRSRGRVRLLPRCVDPCDTFVWRSGGVALTSRFA